MSNGEQTGTEIGYKKRGIIVGAIIVLMILLRGRMGTTTMNVEEFYGVVSIISVFAAGAIYAEWRYHAPQLISETRHASMHPLAREKVGDFWIFALGGILPLDVYGGEGTIVTHDSLVVVQGHNVMLKCNPTPCPANELPLEIQRVVAKRGYYGPPYLFSIIPSDLPEKMMLKYTDLNEKLLAANAQTTYWKQLADGNFEGLGKASDALRRVQRTAQGKGRLDEIWERPAKERKEE